MIIPIGHDRSVRRLPWMTIAIITACTLVQLYAQFAGPDAGDLLRLASAHDRAPSPEAAQAIEQQFVHLLDKIPAWHYGYHTSSGLSTTLVTSAFVHAGWLHLIGNMLFLFLAGSVLEDRWGRGKFLLFYMAGAVIANLAFMMVYSGPPTILVGASGAISAAMGAFLVFYAGTQVTCWYWLMMRTGTLRIAAYFALPLWLGEQILWAYLERDSELSGVAYAAHIGGFVFGAGFALFCNQIFGRREHEDDDLLEPAIPKAKAVRAANHERDRFATCMEAIQAHDLETVRTLASRTLLELSRASDPRRMLELYTAILANLDSVPITDGAFAVTAGAADGEPELYTRIANDFDREHPTSPQLPKVLWRLAQYHRDAGRVEQAVATLEALATRFPTSLFGAQAAEALASRRAT